MIQISDFKRFNLPAHLAVNKHSLVQVLEKQLDRIIENKLNRQNEEIQLVLRRSGPLELSVHGFQLHFILPLHIDIQKKVIGRNISLEGGIILHWQSVLELLGSDIFRFQSHMGSFEWSKDPRLDLGAVAIPIKSIADTILNSKARTLTDQIDHSINSFLAPKTHIKSLLDELHEGIAIGQAKEVLITGELEQMRISHFRQDNEWIRVDINLAGLLMGYTHDLPEFRMEKNWPILEIKNGADQQFTLPGHAVFSYASLAQLFEEQSNMAQSPLHKYKIKVSQTKLKYTANILELTMQLSGRARGDLRARFDAHFDPVSGNFILRDLSIQLENTSWIHKAAFSVIQDKILNLLHSEISQLVKQQLPKIQSLILNVIERQTRFIGLDVQVEGFQLKFNRVDFKVDHLEAELESTGVLLIKCPDLTILNAYFE